MYTKVHMRRSIYISSYPLSTNYWKCYFCNEITEHPEFLACFWIQKFFSLLLENVHLFSVRDSVVSCFLPVMWWDNYCTAYRYTWFYIPAKGYPKIFFSHKILLMMMMMFLHLFSQRKTEERKLEMWESKERKLGKSISFNTALKFTEIRPFQVNFSELLSTVKQNFHHLKVSFRIRKKIIYLTAT